MRTRHHPRRPVLPGASGPFRALWAGVFALLAAGPVGCDDEADMTGPTGEAPDIFVSASSVTFAETDPALGSAEGPTVTITNQGDAALQVTAIQLSGGDLDAFSLEGPGTATLGAGESLELTLGFSPPRTGSLSTELVIRSNDPDRAEVRVQVTGTAVRFEYAQVDRKGIPALNTVFNHPSGVGPFDKVAYNVASPADDVESYTGLFQTVLEAVQNADPAATAALLLPDELPVSLGAGTTSFAQLNGRALADDATDVALVVTVGVESLRSDHVDANDKPFLSTFPYLAEPHR